MLFLTVVCNMVTGSSRPSLSYREKRHCGIVTWRVSLLLAGLSLFPVRTWEDLLLRLVSFSTPMMRFVAGMLSKSLLPGESMAQPIFPGKVMPHAFSIPATGLNGDNKRVAKVLFYTVVKPALQLDPRLPD